MGYAAKVLLDSVSVRGDRLTTFQVTYPRIIHSETLTHRVMSRSSSSSRAIPITRMMQDVQDDPFIPVYWGRDQRGMQATNELTADEWRGAVEVWLGSRDSQLKLVKDMTYLGVHKQTTNRLLEPWMWITVIISATQWSNFFALRQDAELPAWDGTGIGSYNPSFPAQPEIQVIAHMMRSLHDRSEPVLYHDGLWHLPLLAGLDGVSLTEEGFSIEDMKRVSVGRVARVSYLTHEGTRDPHKDMTLHDGLVANHHLSPFEHIATPSDDPGDWANFRGWKQYRKEIEREIGFKA